MSLSRPQQNYVDNTIKNDKVRDCISSPREYEFMDLLTEIGLVEDVDYKHQYCLHNDDFVIVVDFFFPIVKLVIELDGPDHKDKHQAKMDRMRDRLCHANGFSTLRIKTPMTRDQVNYWRVFIRELLREEVVTE